MNSLGIDTTEFVISFHLVPRGFLQVLPPQNPTLPNSNSILNARALSTVVSNEFL